MVNDPSEHDFSVDDSPVDDAGDLEATRGTRRMREGEVTPLLRVRCPHCYEPISVPEQAFFQEITCPVCGSAFNLASDASTAERGLPPENIGPFRLLEQLGHGQFGSVWKARDKKLDRIVALKVPRRADLDEEHLEMFFREARAAAQLNHECIVAVHDVGREGNSVYIASEYVQGANLRHWLAQRRVTFREAAEVCHALARALHHAHEAGVVHRDLKPANIMMDAAGRPRVMDFGLARRDMGEVTITQEGQVLGTPAYMSPEQALGEGHQADRRSDVYSLGVILYEMLTGERPFRGERQMLILQILSQEPQPPRRLNNRIPRDLETICLKCLEKRPEKRYPTAADLADDLHAWLEKRPIGARPVGRWGRTVRWCRRRPAIAGLLAAVVLVAMVGFLLVTWQASLARNEAQIAGNERDRAEDYLEKLLDSVDQMLVEVGAERLQDEPHMADTRRTLIDEALAFYDWLATQEVSSSRIRRMHAKALLQAGTLRRYLGNEHRRSQDSLETAEILLDELLTDSPADIELVEYLTDVHLQLAVVFQDRGETERARNYAGHAVELVDSLPEQFGSSLMRIKSDALLTLAGLARAEGHKSEAEQHLRSVLTMSGELDERNPFLGTSLLKTHHDLANLLGDQINRRDEAEDHFREAWRLAESFDVETVESRVRLSALLSDFASFLTEAERFEEAEELFGKAVEIKKQLVAEHPTVPEYRLSLAVFLIQHGYSGFLRTTGDGIFPDVERREAALDSYEGELDQAVALLEELVERYPHVSDYTARLTNTYLLLGNVHITRGNVAAARDAWSRRKEFLEKQLEDEPQNVNLMHELAGVIANIAAAHYYEEDLPEALRLNGEALVHECRALAAHPDDMNFLTYYLNQISLRVDVLFGLEQWEDGREALDEFVATAERLYTALSSDRFRYNLRTALTVRAVEILYRPGLDEAEYLKAEQDVRRTLELTHLDEPDGEYRGLLAVASLRLGDTQPLLDWAQEFFDHEEAHDWARNWAFAAVAAARAGRDDLARVYAERSRAGLESAPSRQRFARYSVTTLLSEVESLLPSEDGCLPLVR